MPLKVAVLFLCLSFPVLADFHGEEDLPTPEVSPAPWSEQRRQIEEAAERADLTKKIERRLRALPEVEARKLVSDDLAKLSLTELKDAKTRIATYYKEHSALTDEAKKQVTAMKEELRQFRVSLTNTSRFTGKPFTQLRKSLDKLETEMSEKIADMSALAELQDRLIHIDDSITFAIRSTWIPD